jgi:sterol 3beta-glucosyltransferase
MVYKAGAGPPPIPHKTLNAQNLREAIKFALTPGAKSAAIRMAAGIRDEVCNFSNILLRT